MGQKTHPYGFRLGVVKEWKSRWYAERDFPKLLKEDEVIRKYLHRRMAHAALAHVEIERKPSKIVITLHTARPGVSSSGSAAQRSISFATSSPCSPPAEVSVNVEEIKRPELSARVGRRERGPPAPAARSRSVVR